MTISKASDSAAGAMQRVLSYTGNGYSWKHLNINTAETLFLEYV